MREARGELDLPEKSIVTQRHGQRRFEHLDRDLAAMLRIVREVHRGHPAATDLTQHAIAIRQRGREILQLCVAHGQ